VICCLLDGRDSMSDRNIAAFPFTMSRTAVGPTKASFHIVSGAFSFHGNEDYRRIKLSSYYNLMPRLRMSGSFPPRTLYAFISWHLLNTRISLPFVDVCLLDCNAVWTYRQIPTFRGNILLHLHGWRWWVCSVFRAEDGGSMLLRKVGI
jgi:hypothetical protein